MKKILAFSFFPAFVPPSNGGESRLFNFYNALSKWFEIILLTSTHPGVKEEVIHHGLRFVERRIPRDAFFLEQYSTLTKYSSGGDLSAPAVAASGKFPTCLHQAYLEEYDKADIIIHDSPFTVDYDLFMALDLKLRVYNSYNCETNLYRQLHIHEKSVPIHEIIHQAELRMLEHSDLVFYCNQDDLVAFRSMLPEAKFEAVYTPHGMSPAVRQQIRLNNYKEKFSAVFMGSGHPPNIQAAEFIVYQLAPGFPEINFDIIGNCLPEGEYQPNIHRHSKVSDKIKSDILYQADLALNPMKTGSGSNVKVMDYLSHGLPVLSTPLGMRGIIAEVGKEYIVASLEQFPEVFRSISAQPDLLARVAAAGKTLAFNQYSWERIAKVAAENLDRVAEKKAISLFNRFVLVLNDYDSFEGVGGGSTRTRGLYMAVRDWCPVVFICFSSNGRLTIRKEDEKITVITIPKAADHLAELLHVNAMSFVAADDIIASRYSLKNPYLAAIYQILRRLARCIVVEHCYMVDVPITWGDRFVYSSQNNETELKKRLLDKHPLKSELLYAAARVEREAVERSAVTIAVSQQDAKSIVLAKRTAGPVIVVRNGAATPETGDRVEEMQKALLGKVDASSVVFVGSAHVPNVEAANFIIKQIAPQCKNIQFHLLGSVCNSIHDKPANVYLWGVVDDTTKAAVMKLCAVAINPMLSGGGSNVKLADYIGNGLFVITTEMGQRGYPSSIREHLDIVTLEKFPLAIQSALRNPKLISEQARQSRHEVFNQHLAMQSLAERFVVTLQEMEIKRKRVLYVAYRYIDPPHGGAEINIEKFVTALGQSNIFDIDVVAPEISSMQNLMRFSEIYSFDRESGAPIDIPNVRYGRFSADFPEQAFIERHMQAAWRVQPIFESAVGKRLANNYFSTGLTWGWGYPEGEAEFASRWAFTECGIFLEHPSQISIQGFTPGQAVITVLHNGMIVSGPLTLEGRFEISFEGPAGELEIHTSTSRQPDDPRSLGFLLRKFAVADKSIDIMAPTLIQQLLPNLAAETTFRILDEASEETRKAYNVRLTDGRGPWSQSLERYIANHVEEYDLVVTHNNIFRPAVVAITEAKRKDVPSILIPHAHLDDDFYHFPDLVESAQNATVVLAASKEACNFFEHKGCNVRYMPAGCDTEEEYSQQDVEEFMQVFKPGKPFILVLGRKAGAKGYRKIINAVEKLNSDGIHLHAVLIGPDDDGIPIKSKNATYLGRQPRSVVRGALLSCIALCNMSISESFGIVLLEAWLAGKPVIVNKNCAAFHAMATDRVNALMVDDDLDEKIREIVSNAELRDSLARNGKTVCDAYGWKTIGGNFVEICKELARNKELDK
jgi:glycosyltransferase involved in cell wall biosynthesis